MKKKIKLISTFASLGLALALMVFGVYAATSVSFSVTTQVTFKETQHVKATVAAAHTAAYAKDATPSYTDVELTDASAGFTGQTEDATIGDITFAAVTLEQGKPCYSYKITITNNDAEDGHKLYVKATWTAAPTQDAQFTVVFTGVGNDTEQEIAYGEPLEITCTVTVTDLAGNSIQEDINDYMAMEVALYTKNA